MINIRVELLWLLAALLSLSMGALVYIMDRDPASVYFLSNNISLYDSRPNFFSQAGYYLPTFFHSFSLILMTAAIIGSQKVSVFTVCLIWMLIETIFEIAQLDMFSVLIAANTPDWFEFIPVLDNTRSYFHHGTYDANDLLSIIAGTTAAFILLQLTKRSGTDEAPEKKYTI